MYSHSPVLGTMQQGRAGCGEGHKGSGWLADLHRRVGRTKGSLMGLWGTDKIVGIGFRRSTGGSSFWGGGVSSLKIAQLGLEWKEENSPRAWASDWALQASELCSEHVDLVNLFLI